LKNLQKWSCRNEQHQQGDYIYSMQIVGTLEEAHNHADNLGLSEPELVVANVPVLHDGFH